DAGEQLGAVLAVRAADDARDAIDLSLQGAGAAHQADLHERAGNNASNLCFLEISVDAIGLAVNQGHDALSLGRIGARCEVVEVRHEAVDGRRTSVRSRLSAATSRAAVACLWLAAADSNCRRALSRFSAVMLSPRVSLARRSNC